MVSAEGGPVKRITRVRVEGGETAHLSPHMQRDGRGVLYTVWRGGISMPRVDVVDLQTGEQKTVVEHGCSAKLVLTPRGPHLLWVRRNTLFAAPYDESAMQLAGPETALADNVLTDAPNAVAMYDASDEGTLVYAPGPLFGEETRLAWADLTAGEGSTPLSDDRFPCGDPRFSADGRRLSLVLRRNAYQSFV